MKPLLLDLCCGAGAASFGYVMAGFDVVGVDLVHQPRYGWEFHQADALDYLAVNGHRFHAVHISPPCQRWTQAQRIRGREHPDLITPARKLLHELDVPYVIENVVGAPLVRPIELCGAMFPWLRVYRHRLFETNFPIASPWHPEHTVPLAKMGRRPFPDEFMHVVGYIPDVREARAAMGVTWNMTGDELVEAIPPAYTEYVGLHLRAHVMARPAPERPFYRRDVVVG